MYIHHEEVIDFVYALQFLHHDGTIRVALNFLLLACFAIALKGSECEENKH